MQYTTIVVGNAAQQNYLQKQVKSGTVPHANLWVGPKHIGKTSLVSNLSYQLMCLEPSLDGIPCLRCQHCVMVKKDVHPNITFLQPNDKGIIAIEAIRELILDLQQSNFIAGYHVIIVEQAETMSLAAANAVLKNLEEPHDDILFFLLTDKAESLPETVRSRCAVMEFYKVGIDELHQHWPNDSSAISLASGLPGKLISLKKGRAINKLEDKVNLWISIIEESSFSNRLSHAKSLWGDSLSKKQVYDNSEIIESVSRDILLLQNHRTAGIENEFAIKRLKNVAQETSIQQTLVALHRISTLKDRIQQHVQLKLIMTDLLLTLYR